MSERPWPSLGCGVGLRNEHYDLVTREWPRMDWFEAISENFMDSGGRPLHILEAVRRRYPVVHLQFKLIFLDCGLYDVVRSSLKHFWPRLTSGGVMLFDHFNHEVAPGETRAIKEFMPDAKIRTFSFGWMPTAYVVKP